MQRDTDKLTVVLLPNVTMPKFTQKWVTTSKVQAILKAENKRDKQNLNLFSNTEANDSLLCFSQSRKGSCRCLAKILTQFKRRSREYIHFFLHVLLLPGWILKVKSQAESFQLPFHYTALPMRKKIEASSLSFSSILVNINHVFIHTLASGFGQTNLYFRVYTMNKMMKGI